MHVPDLFASRAGERLRACRALRQGRQDRRLQRRRTQQTLLAEFTQLGDIPSTADVRAIAVHATDAAIATATMTYHFAGNTGLHHPHVIGRLLRDLNTAGIHQIVSDTAYENHGKFRLGLPADPLA